MEKNDVWKREGTLTATALDLAASHGADDGQGRSGPNIRKQADEALRRLLPSSWRRVDLDEVAYHEAGHAVVAVKLGRWFRHVEIAPRDAEGSHYVSLGRVVGLWFPEATAESVEEEAAYRDILAVLWAGVEASALACGYRRRPQLRGSDRETRDRVLSLLPLKTTSAGARESAASRRRAGQILWDHWRAVEVVAEELWRTEWLSCEEVQEIVGDCPPAVHPVQDAYKRHCLESFELWKRLQDAQAEGRSPGSCHSR